MISVEAHFSLLQRGAETALCNRPRLRAPGAEHDCTPGEPIVTPVGCVRDPPAHRDGSSHRHRTVPGFGEIHVDSIATLFSTGRAINATLFGPARSPSRPAENDRILDQLSEGSDGDELTPVDTAIEPTNESGFPGKFGDCDGSEIDFV